MLLRFAAACVCLTLLGGATCGVPRASELPPAATQTRDVLGPGDVIEVRVFNEPELSGTHQVSENGTVRLPLVGSIAVVGLTPDEVGQTISRAYNASYLKDAQVSLFVKAYNSRKVFVLGQVAKPGAIAFEGKLTVIGAIARAGGTTKLSDPDRTLMTRDDDGKQVRVVVEVGRIGKGQAPDVELQPGDIIFVPETLF